MSAKAGWQGGIVKIVGRFRLARSGWQVMIYKARIDHKGRIGKIGKNGAKNSIKGNEVDKALETRNPKTPSQRAKLAE